MTTEKVSPTGRVVIVGAGDIPRAMMDELLRMGHEAVTLLNLEMSEEEVRSRLNRVVSADFAKLERRVLAQGHDRAVTFRAVYGRTPIAEALLHTAREAEPVKNDPWYRREARGGKRNRRW